MSVIERYKEYINLFEEKNNSNGCFQCFKEITDGTKMCMLIGNIIASKVSDITNTSPVILFHQECFYEAAGNAFNLDFDHSSVTNIIIM